VKVKSVIPTPYVIPAKAGVGMTIALDSHWIPASAGMTIATGSNQESSILG